MFRGRSKERGRKVTPPGPSYMSNDQFANYLTDLRNNRVSRPSGARPQPQSTNSARESVRPSATPLQDDSAATPTSEFAPRSTSSMSHRRAQSSLSTYSSVTSRTGRYILQQPVRDSSIERPLLKASEVVPSGTYIERGQRWMEKEEAVSLRDAMEDMDLKKQEEEERIRNAAQEEASELVWQHQNPGTAVNPNAPYSYKDHLRKNSYQHARTQSAGPYNGTGVVNGLGRDMPRSLSGGSVSSGDMVSQSRTSNDSSRVSRTVSPEKGARASMDSSRDFAPRKSQKPYGSINNSTRPQGSSRRSSARRNISGEVAGVFTGEQIWEEPEEDRGRSTAAQDLPAPLQIKPRNPLNRVQFAHEPSRAASTPPFEPTKRLERSEIYKNPPSQSRNPKYTANPPLSKAAEIPVPEVPTKDGLEIRSDEIRQATSMRLKDRSPKLPIPTAVSDRPGRPIVSFDANWKPSEADLKPEERRQSMFKNQQRQGILPRSDSQNVAAPLPTIHTPHTPSVKVNSVPSINIPSINLPDVTPSVPTINLPDSTPSIPTFNFPDSSSSTPTISFPDEPKISVSAPTIAINGSNTNTRPQSARPLPDPKTAGGRPLPRHHATAPISRSHWSPAAGRRATATCHQCQLPIEGRVVGLRGAAEKYHPECFICFTCGTGLEALEVFEEPPAKRRERLDRIQLRAQGEALPELEGQTYAEDGDPRLRYFCHLDWHELYAPKCKHCKTSILGEHMIALGEHWHFGHFFCAECGDPFEKGMSHIEKDGYAWCLSCQTKRTERRAPKCKKCKLPVIGDAIQALDGEWHDKCFRCVTCKGDFPDGCFFPKLVGTDMVVLCTRCMEMELKA